VDHNLFINKERF